MCQCLVQVLSVHSNNMMWSLAHNTGLHTWRLFACKRTHALQCILVVPGLPATSALCGGLRCLLSSPCLCTWIQTPQLSAEHILLRAMPSACHCSDAGTTCRRFPAAHFGRHHPAEDPGQRTGSGSSFHLRVGVSASFCKQTCGRLPHFCRNGFT